MTPARASRGPRRLAVAGASLALPLLALQASAAAEDPFAPLGRASGASSAAARAATAHGIRDPFTPLGAAVAPSSVALVSGRSDAAQDPFRALFAPTVPARERPTPGSGAGVEGTPNGPYTVMLSSIRIGAGRAAADAEASKFRRAGLPNVGVLLSSQFPSLRRGYYVVYSGSYATASAAAAGAVRARRFSRTAYAHRL